MKRLKFVCPFLSGQSCFMTKSNRKCQNWSVQVPHEHKYFSKYGWTDNACRAYDHDVPWCYTTDPNKRWEECDCSLEDGKIRHAKTTGSGSILMFRWNLLYYPVKSKMSILEHTGST